jgi:hypothetical protein
MTLSALAHAWKTIPFAPSWTDPDPNDGYLRLSTTLEIAGVTEAGLTLDVGTYQHNPDEHVTYEMAVLDHNSARRIRLMRLDWRSLRGGHSNNPRKCSGKWAGKRVPDTHLHSFALNWVEAENRMKKGKLPCAEPIAEPLQSFAELTAYVGTCFRIKNIGLVPEPDWVYDLFARR